MEEFALRFAQAAAHMLWVGALIGLAAFLVDRLGIRSPASRHGVHLLGMLAILAAFPLCFLSTDVTAPDGPDGLGERAVTEVAEKEVPRPSAVVTEELASTEMDGASLPPPDSGLLPAEPGTDTRSSEAANPGGDTDAGIWREIGPLVSGSDLLGLLIMSLRLILGWVGSSRLRKRGDSITSGLWWDSLEAIRERIRTRGEVSLAWSREVAAPVVMGFIKPAILLPISLASRLKPEQIEAVLAHELAHLARRDTWAVLVQRVVETVLFFHPAVWWMSRRMEEAREEACDDLVLAAGCDPADYAEALLICSECRLEQAGISAKLAERLAATGGHTTSLQQRVLRLLGQGESGQVRLGRAGWVLGALAA
ncbi:MAG: M56 family metallopeptidase, partial [Verrucomicrobiales bacterium]